MDINKHLSFYTYLYFAYFCYISICYKVKTTILLFGERLMQIRKKKKLSQSEVGKLLGIDGDTLKRIEEISKLSD